MCVRMNREIIPSGHYSCRAGVVRTPAEASQCRGREHWHFKCTLLQSQLTKIQNIFDLTFSGSRVHYYALPLLRWMFVRSDVEVPFHFTAMADWLGLLQLGEQPLPGVGRSKVGWSVVCYTVVSAVCQSVSLYLPLQEFAHMLKTEPFSSSSSLFFSFCGASLIPSIIIHIAGDVGGLL